MLKYFTIFTIIFIVSTPSFSCGLSSTPKYEKSLQSPICTTTRITDDYFSTSCF